MNDILAVFLIIGNTVIGPIEGQRKAPPTVPPVYETTEEICERALKTVGATRGEISSCVSEGRGLGSQQCLFPKGSIVPPSFASKNSWLIGRTAVFCIPAPVGLKR